MSGIDRVEEHGALSFRAGDIEVARYVTMRDAPALESPRPYFHPLRTLGGTPVSGYRPHDHAWHWGLSIAVANIDVPGEALPVNLWGGVTYTADRGYVQLDNNGEQVHDSWDATGTERLSWHTPRGRAFMAESRTVEPSLVDLPGGGRAWRLDLTSEWTNLTDGVIRFGSPTTAGRENAGYGGLFLRAAPGFSTASVVGPAGPVPVDEAMGLRVPWLALSTDTATVAITADPRNPVSDSPFFVRTGTPMLNAAPFFCAEWPLAAGETALWRWTLLVSDGCLDAATIATALAG